MKDEVKTLMTMRSDGVTKDTDAKTPAIAPNVRIVVLRASSMVAIRVLRVYLMGVCGYLGLSAVGVIDPQPLGSFLAKFWLALQMAAPPAIASLLWNTLELLGKVDVNFPEMRG